MFIFLFKYFYFIFFFIFFFFEFKRFFYAHSGCGVKIDGLEVNNFESKTYQEFMVMYTSTKENGINNIIILIFSC